MNVRFPPLTAAKRKSDFAPFAAGSGEHKRRGLMLTVHSAMNHKSAKLAVVAGTYEALSHQR